MSESRVRIFVSSPSDVDRERSLVKDIVERLAQEYLPYFAVEAVLWEEEALTAARSFQAGLLRPSECDIVLVMLWTRLGTPLANEPYGGMTGTEWEFVEAVDASARHGRPEVMVYRKTAPRLVDVTDAEATSAAVEDRRRLETFFAAHFFNADGSFRRAFRQFDSDRGLRDLVDGQLRKLLNRRIGAERGVLRGAGDGGECPFRTGRPFEQGDAAAFVGRETETRELIARLDALKGRGLLLISGASGVGKSSLVRAGLLPRLARPFAFPGIAACRWCLIEHQGSMPGGTLPALAQALMDPGLLGPALCGFGLDGERLVRLLAADPGLAADQVRAALDLADQAQPGGAGQGRTQLALILDPMDGLFDESSLADPQTQSLAAALAALAARDGIWILATLRSDRLGQLHRLPDLAALLEEGGRFPLEPLPPARVRQAMEIPARVAGIEYEEGASSGAPGLVDLLESEATRLVHWPPLLELALESLHGRSLEPRAGGDPGRQLTLAAYREMGGVAGATLERAEALWATLPQGARDALPRLCRALIALEGGPGARPKPREGDLLTLTRDPGAARLIQGLLEARLAVAQGVPDPTGLRPCPGDDPGALGTLARVARQSREEWRVRLAPGSARAAVLDSSPPTEHPETDPGQELRVLRPVVALAHPVLIQRWGPVRDWLLEPDNRRDLRLRLSISHQARQWRGTDCNREHLLGELGFAAALGFAEAHGDELMPLERELIDASLSNLRQQRRRNRRARALGLTLAVLLGLATAAAIWALDASRKATLSLHRSLLDAADLEIGRGNTPEAVRLALDAGQTMPREATDTLSRAFSANRLIAMAQAEGASPLEPIAPSFGDDGRLLATLSAADGARLWSLESDRYVQTGRVGLPGPSIHRLRFVSGQGEPELLGIGSGGVWRLPAAPGAQPDWGCAAPFGTPFALRRGTRLLALAHPLPGGGFGVCVADLGRPGAPLWDLPLHRGEVRSLGFSPDGALLLTASRDGRALVLDAQTGRTRFVLPPEGPLDRPINRASFDPQGKRIAIASGDERVRIYDIEGRPLAELGTLVRDGRPQRIHKSAVRDAAFSPDGRWAVAGDDEGQVVRWDLVEGTASILGQHALSVERIKVSAQPDAGQGEPLALSASLDKTARLWGLHSGKEVAVFSHRAAVSNARFASDGQRILTYSAQDGSARVWSVEPSSSVGHRLAQKDHVWHLDLAVPPPGLDRDPKALLIATAAFDGAVTVWRWDRSAPRAAPIAIWRLAGHSSRVRRVAFSPSASRLASAAFDGSVRVWDMVTGGGCALGGERPAQGVRPTEYYRAIFAPDDAWLLTASNDPQGPVRLWDPAACAPLPLPEALAQTGDRVQAATVGPGPSGTQIVATGDDSGTLSLARRDAQGDWSALCRLQVSGGAIADLALTQDGAALAAADENGLAILLELGDSGCGEPRRLEGGSGALYSVAFSPDGATLVSASVDGRAQVWDRAGRHLADLVGHKDRVYGAQYSPDGRWILTASRDGTLRLWERPSATPPRGREVPALESYLALSAGLGGAAFAAFTPDGQGIAAAYWENAAVLWRLWDEETDTGPEAQQAQQALERVWGKDRARLALIREAERFRRDNRLDATPRAPEIHRLDPAGRAE